MRFIYKKDYLKQFDRCSGPEKHLIIIADKEIRRFYTSRTAAYGLRIKKLFEKNEEKTYEARVSDKLRILWVELQDSVVFAFIGNHDEIRRYIKRFR
jgi:hypothetical protein